ncbi:hypothetical protein [Mycolicibacterium helvum]|uniref:Uncharacterized protein n=1 Tax=Mycolicibacterium helvum TaxID=1534349 RepID=A0A7I7T8X8_9MYCO|nr:hypothetical protein [Mycolicibacterium helvum]BBY64919.1 hypothetical protein MHEL_31620 [Mycolicibacterium helvum]
MRFSLIVEHRHREGANAVRAATEKGYEEFVMLDAGCLSEAARLAAQLNGKRPLLRVHVSDVHPPQDTKEIFLPPRRTAIVSLIHDASLLGIAVGATITADDGVVGHVAMREGVARDLNDLGYRVFLDPNSRPAGQHSPDRAEPSR